METLTKLLGEEAADHYRLALEKCAAEVAGNDHRNASQAKREFSLTDRDIKSLPKTNLPGRSKPVYLIKHIIAYKNEHTFIK